MNPTPHVAAAFRYSLDPFTAAKYRAAFITCALQAGHYLVEVHLRYHGAELGAFRHGIADMQGAHAPDEYFLIDSTNPKVAGLVDATMGFAEFLYTLAAIK